VEAETVKQMHLGEDEYHTMTSCGHTFRSEGETLDKDIIDGASEGSRSTERLRRRWIDETEDWTGLKYHNATESMRVN